MPWFESEDSPPPPTPPKTKMAGPRGPRVPVPALPLDLPTPTEDRPMFQQERKNSYGGASSVSGDENFSDSGGSNYHPASRGAGFVNSSPLKMLSSAASQLFGVAGTYGSWDDGSRVMMSTQEIEAEAHREREKSMQEAKRILAMEQEQARSFNIENKSRVPTVVTNNTHDGSRQLLVNAEYFHGNPTALMSPPLSNQSHSPNPSMTSTSSIGSGCKGSPNLLIPLAHDPNSLDTVSSLVALSKQFQKQEKWSVTHVRTLEKRMFEMEQREMAREKQWLDDQDRAATREIALRNQVLDLSRLMETLKKDLAAEKIKLVKLQQENVSTTEVQKLVSSTSTSASATDVSASTAVSATFPSTPATKVLHEASGYTPSLDPPAAILTPSQIFSSSPVSSNPTVGLGLSDSSTKSTPTKSKATAASPTKEYTSSALTESSVPNASSTPITPSHEKTRSATTTFDTTSPRTNSRSANTYSPATTPVRPLVVGRNRPASTYCSPTASPSKSTPMPASQFSAARMVSSHHKRAKSAGVEEIGPAGEVKLGKELQSGNNRRARVGDLVKAWDGGR